MLDWFPPRSSPSQAATWRTDGESQQGSPQTAPMAVIRVAPRHLPCFVCFSGRLRITPCAWQQTSGSIEAAVIPTLLYGIEAWVLYCLGIRLLEYFMNVQSSSSSGRTMCQIWCPPKSQPVIYWMPTTQTAATLGWPRCRDGKHAQTKMRAPQWMTNETVAWPTLLGSDTRTSLASSCQRRPPTVIAAGASGSLKRPSNVTSLKQQDPTLLYYYW